MLHKPEEKIHVGTGPTGLLVQYNGQTVTCLTRKKTKALLWTADAGVGRAANLGVDHKGDFLAWVDVSAVTFPPRSAA